LQRFGLPTQTDHPADVLAEVALSDKKRSGDSVKLILPERIGKCRIEPTPADQLLSLIQAGL
jgi:3-dehydroquinate synthetase